MRELPILMNGAMVCANPSPENAFSSLHSFSKLEVGHGDKKALVPTSRRNRLPANVSAERADLSTAKRYVGCPPELSVGQFRVHVSRERSTIDIKFEGLSHAGTPTLFSAPMVCAILEGRKTVMQRIVKDTRATEYWPFGYGDLVSVPRCRYGKPDDGLWVRETYFGNHFEHRKQPTDERALHYRADSYENWFSTNATRTALLFIRR